MSGEPVVLIVDAGPADVDGELHRVVTDETSPVTSTTQGAAQVTTDQTHGSRVAVLEAGRPHVIADGGVGIADEPIRGEATGLPPWLALLEGHDASASVGSSSMAVDAATTPRCSASAACRATAAVAGRSAT